MSYELKEIKHPSYEELSGLTWLWSSCFGDNDEFIRTFYEKMPVHSTVCCMDNGVPVSMAVLLDVGGAYYGYAVCTAKEHRGKGLCRRIHKYIKEKCLNENTEYFVHPANDALCSLYLSMGLTNIMSCYEIKSVSRKDEKIVRVDPSEYASIRSVYFSGKDSYLWGVGALQLMEKNGIIFLSAYIDGICCGAALEGDCILELCAPDHLLGRSAGAFLSAVGEFGYVRFLTEPSHADRCALMSFSGKQVYFNIFFE